jgi:hypothetical protein
MDSRLGREDLLDYLLDTFSLFLLDKAIEVKLIGSGGLNKTSNIDKVEYLANKL